MIYATKQDARARIGGQHHIHLIIQHTHAQQLMDLAGKSSKSLREAPRRAVPPAVCGYVSN